LLAVAERRIEELYVGGGEVPGLRVAAEQS
jgi:hypothetical protein